MKASRIALLWGALFVATFGVRNVIGAHTSHPKKTPEQLLQDAMADLESKPRRTTPLSLDAMAQMADETLDRAITNFLRTHEVGLQVCRRVVMLRSTRPSEYFEISFAVAPEATNEHTFELREVVLERSSLEVTPLERRCIETQFENLKVTDSTVELADEALSRRSAYRFCFRNLAHLL